MEQLLQTLLAEKRTRSGGVTTTLSPLTVAAQYLYAYCSSNQNTTFASAPPSTAAPREEEAGDDKFEGGNGGADPTTVANVEATVVQTQVNIRVLSRRRPGQLLRVTVALEKLRLSVLHLSVTSLADAVVYSLILKVNLSVSTDLVIFLGRKGLHLLGHTHIACMYVAGQMEEDCELTSAEEIAAVVHEIFSTIATCG